MRIGIDARHDQAGPGRYTFSLIRELAAIDRENEYVLFLRPGTYRSFKLPGPNFRKVPADFHWFTVAEQLKLPRLIHEAKLDLVHYPHINAPLLATTPFVVTIHDLNYSHLSMARPGLKSQLKYTLKAAGYAATLQKLKRARAVITVSEYSKGEIVKELGVDPRKITVTYEGADPAGFGKPDRGALKRFGVTKPYFLYVGSAYPYKNLIKLIEAFGLVSHRGGDYQLVLAGDHERFGPALQARAAELDLEGKVLFPGRVSDAELAALYEGALAYTFVSVAEGFGLPGLEAMAAGVPVLAARATSLPEVYAGAALYVDPTDPDTIAIGLERIASDEELRTDLIQKGRERLKQFSWRKMAEQTLQVYREALAKR